MGRGNGGALLGEQLVARRRNVAAVISALALLLPLVVGVFGASPASAQADLTSTGGSIVGSITEFDGTPVAAVQADLFATAADGGRGDYLSSDTTGDDGVFDFAVEAGCYTITVIAPDGRTINGSQWYQPAVCVADGEQVDIGSIALDAIADAVIEGKVTFDNGDPAEGVAIDLFLENDEGGRANFLGSTRTGPDGTYQFAVAGDCYVITMIAPDNLSFPTGAYFQTSVCVAGGGPADGIDAVLSGPPPADSGLGGMVTDGTGAPAPGVAIDLFNTGADGSRTSYISTAITGDDGRFSALLDPGCYWLIYIAPSGETFNGGQYLEKFQCLDPGQMVDDLDAMLDAGDQTDISIAVANARGPEGAAGDSSVIEAMLTLSAASPTDLSVEVRTSNGSATAGEDYEAIPAGTTLTIAAGTTTLAVPVTILGDNVDEGNETFTVRLSNPSTGLTIADGIGQITIVDDDDPVVGNPPSIDDQRFSVEEYSSVGTVIGTVAATSNSGGTLTYSLDDSSVVAIDAATGELTVAGPLGLAPDTTVTVQATVDDGESASAAIAIDVTRLTLLPNPNQTTTTNGGTLTVEITAPADRTNTPTGPLTIEGLAGLDGTAGAASVTYVVDVSGSTASRGNDCNGDGVVDEGDNFNAGTGDTVAGTILDCEIAGLLALNRSLSRFNVEVSLVVFGSSGAVVDVSPADEKQVFTSPTADVDGNGAADIEEALTGVIGGGATQFSAESVGGGTDYRDALTAAISAMGQRQAGRAGFLFFLSDGRASVSQTVVQQVADAGLVANTYSVGVNSDGCGVNSDLQEIADGTGGTCTEVDDPGALTAALTEAPENLESVVVSIDGGEPVPAALNPLGQWSVEVPELSQGRHVLRATVRATDGTEVGAEILSLRFD